MNDLKALTETLREAAGAAGSNHPEAEVLAAYLADELEPELENGVRTHLVACRECTARLLDLDALEAESPEVVGDSGEVADLARHAAWRELEARLEAGGGEAVGDGRIGEGETPAADRAVAAGGSGTTAARRPWLAVAAALSVLVLSFWVARLVVTVERLEGEVARMQEPEANTLMVYLDPITRSASVPPDTVELGPEQRHWVLVSTPPDLGAEGVFERYRLELVDADGEIRILSDALELNDHGTLRLGLGRDSIPAGDYRMRLWGMPGAQTEDEPGAAEPVLVEERPLRVISR
ncbi:MAG: hypothetical protein MI919_38835 [Holophagales bacterium]|nr:hypothetical protein [Holophagales bacterium]